MNYILLLKGYFTQLFHGQLPWGENSNTGPFLKVFGNFRDNLLKCIDRYEQKREIILKTIFQNAKYNDVSDLSHFRILALKKHLKCLLIAYQIETHNMSNKVRLSEGKHTILYKDNERQLVTDLKSECESFMISLRCCFGGDEATKVNEQTRNNVMSTFLEIKKHINEI